MKVHNLLYRKNQWSSSFPTQLDSERTLIFVFADPKRKDFSPLKDLVQHFPKSMIVGCSSAGEIHNEYVYDESLSVSICCFEKTKLKVYETNIHQAEDSFLAGENIGKQLLTKDLQGIFLLSEGLTVNGTELTRGINSVVQKDHAVVISGGLSADGSSFQSTYTIHGSDVRSHRVVAVGFYGHEIQIGTGSFGGWDAFGPLRTVTKSSANVLYELDGKPALELYKQYLGQEADKLPGSALLFPLSISTGTRKNIVRTVLAVNEAEQSMTFAGDIPQGSSAQLMKANFSHLVTGAENAAMFAGKNLDKNEACLAIAVSCVGRRLVLGEAIEDETEAVKNILPKGTLVSGFYSYGELSPHGEYGCDLHNQTMTLTVFQEKKAA